jgi:hypothetical protein
LSEEDKLGPVNVIVLSETVKFPLCTIPLIEQIIFFAETGVKGNLSLVKL